MANIVFACSTCNQEFDAPASMAGEITDCPSCKTRIQVPDSASVKTLSPLPKRSDQVQRKEVIIVDVQMPFNSVCWICLKVVGALLLIFAFLGAIFMLLTMWRTWV